MLPPEFYFSVNSLNCRLIDYNDLQVTVYCIFVAIMAFNARVSDPRFGGTYMTMLNTVANLGGNWPTTAALWFVDGLTWKTCLGAKTEGLHCNDKAQIKVGTRLGLQTKWVLYLRGRNKSCCSFRLSYVCHNC